MLLIHPLYWLLISTTFGYAENGTISVSLDSSRSKMSNENTNIINRIPYRSGTNSSRTGVIKPNGSFRKIYRFPTSAPKQIGQRYQNQNLRYGPFFEEDPEPRNITVRVGATVQMDCKIALLRNKTVSWLHRKGESIHLLTVGRQAYSTDQRITLSFRYPNNWRLQIASITTRDDGIYECQIATHPATVKIIYLAVSAPEVKILDEKGVQISERYYKAGSRVDLKCHASQVQMPEDKITWWKSNILVSKGIKENTTALPGIILSTLIIDHAEKRHSGNYTCMIGQLAASSLFVHILNGELPAAVHDGSSGTIVSSFITIWLITLCCIFGTVIRFVIDDVNLALFIHSYNL